MLLVVFFHAGTGVAYFGDFIRVESMSSVKWLSRTECRR